MRTDLIIFHASKLFVGSVIFIPICEAACVALQASCIAGCAAATVCFHPQTQIRLDGLEISTDEAANLREGQNIKTLSTDGLYQAADNRIVKVIKETGDFDFLEFNFTKVNCDSTVNLRNRHKESGSLTTQSLKVTLEHMVIANGKIMTASSVNVGDVFYVMSENGNTCVSEVQHITSFKHHEKISLITETGTAIANNVFTTTVCNAMMKKDETSSLVDFFFQYKRIHKLLNAAEIENKVKPTVI